MKNIISKTKNNTDIESILAKFKPVNQQGYKASNMKQDCLGRKLNAVLAGIYTEVVRLDLKSREPMSEEQYRLYVEERNTMIVCAGEAFTNRIKALMDKHSQ